MHDAIMFMKSLYTQFPTHAAAAKARHTHLTALSFPSVITLSYIVFSSGRGNNIFLLQQPALLSHNSKFLTNYFNFSTRLFTGMEALNL